MIIFYVLAYLSYLDFRFSFIVVTKLLNRVLRSIDKLKNCLFWTMQPDFKFYLIFHDSQYVVFVKKTKSISTKKTGQ